MASRTVRCNLCGHYVAIVHDDYDTAEELALGSMVIHFRETHDHELRSLVDGAGDGER